MSENEIKYQRLTSVFKYYTGWSRGSLWLGPDHLLKIRSTGYKESYRRYYLKDIQAITLTETKSWITAAVIFLFVDIIFSLIGFAIGGTGGIILALFTVLPITLALVIDLLLGPSCVCRIHTAVQADRVEALPRLRGARRVIERLRPIVQEAQGGFSAEDVAAMASLAAPGGAGPLTAEPLSSPTGHQES